MWHICVLVGKPERKEHLPDISIVGETVLEWVLIKWDGRT